MSNLSGFDASTVPESTLLPVPEGRYVVMATSSEVKDNKAGTGQYLQFLLELLDERYAGKKIWVRLNLWNPNATAVAIAQRELADICLAVGIPRPNDSSELLNTPFCADLVVEKDERNREQNVVKGYAKADAIDAAPKATPKTKAATNTPAGAPAASVPWKK